MKTQRLLQALTDIDDAAIEAAHPVHDRPHSHFRAVWAAAAALAVTAAAVAVALWPRDTTPAPTDGSWPIKYVEVVESAGELGVIKKWHEKTQPERFSELETAAAKYVIGSTTPLPPEKVGKPLGATTVRGYDVYTETVYEALVTYYAIVGIDSACAVAVQFAGETAWYPYTDPWYTPATLAQFISDLSLREHLTTASVWYRPDSRRNVEFEGLPTDTVWELLLSDGSPANVALEWPDTVMTVSVSLPLLGVQNVSLAVTADGYLTTNLLGTLKAFYIGTEAVNAFTAYVMANCDGHEIVYVSPEADTPVPEGGTAETTTVYSLPHTP